MRQRYVVTYLILLAIQVALGGLLNLSQYMIICFLPVMIMSLPVTSSPYRLMLVAFISGFAVDFLTHGAMGLTVAALLPVAYARNALIRLVFGAELLSRKEDISIHKQGPGKILLSILLANTLYFIIFIPLDCAGTRSFGFMTVRLLLSVALSTAVSYYVAGVLAPLEADRWR